MVVCLCLCAQGAPAVVRVAFMAPQSKSIVSGSSGGDGGALVAEVLAALGGADAGLRC